MSSFDGSVIATLWENEVEGLHTLKKNHTLLKSPFLEPKIRIEWNREHLWIYNAILCAALFGIWVLGTAKAISRRRRISNDNVGEDLLSDGTGSDSSSTLTGTATPPDTTKSNNDDDDERKSLLPRAQMRRDGRRQYHFLRRFRAFLMYQPRPLRIINRVLPDNGTTIFVSIFVLFNLILASVNIPFESRMWMVFGDRCACLFAANLPLLYLLAAKNQPLKHITGYSYEALNIFHRRLGEMLCFFAVLHTATIFYIFFSLLRDLLHLSLLSFCYNRVILCGLLALACYEILYFTSLGSFRQRWYELFLASHIFLQIGGLAFLFFHYHTSHPYVLASVLIFVVDRLVYRLMLNSTKVKAGLEVLEDGETLMLSADWAITGKKPLLLGRHCIKNGWEPAAHVFITVPTLSHSAVLQAHPFTIAAAAPDTTAAMPYAWFSLLIRAHDGFTRDLLNHACQHSKVDVRIDGPYGSLEPLHMLEDSDHAIVVAGGSGIAVVFPLIWALLRPTAAERSAEGAGVLLKHKRRQRKVSLVWVIHSASHSSWMPKEWLDELTELGLDVRIPPPTATHGRPDVGCMVEDLVYAGSTKRQTGVVVSGPDALNRDVRNTCARLVRNGVELAVTVEKFGW